MKSKYLHRHDWELVLLIAAMLFTLGGFLLQQLGTVSREGASWRRIDTEAVRKLIQAGDLSDREAEWYRPVTPSDKGSKTER